MHTKHLFRSEKNRFFAGICGGFGEYFNIDPVILRIVWLLVVIFTGFVPGVLAYVIAIFIIPPAPHHVTHNEAPKEEPSKDL
jgi:phage shock protein C